VRARGSSKAKGDALAADILAAGGQAESAELDALDETAVDVFVDGVVARAGRIDISFNLIGYGVKGAKNLIAGLDQGVLA
jgi:3-oxoacyl-[acyl-carrier protein] reductase